MELTKFEKQMKLKQEKERALNLLKISYEFEKWLQENRVSSTYSTFCDDFCNGFGYDAELNKKRTYKFVQHIRNLVLDLVAEY